MKPRLKMMLDGRISVVQAGSLPWSGWEARALLKHRYGSVLQFATYIGVSQGSAYAALTDSSKAKRSAGQIMFVRQVLGLPTHPGPLALRSAQTWVGRRAASGANHVR